MVVAWSGSVYGIDWECVWESMEKGVVQVGSVHRAVSKYLSQYRSV